MTAPLVAIDTESTYFDDLDINTLGATRYAEHPETEHYMVSVSSKDLGIQWAGPPEKCDWDAMRGAIIVAHNMGYDEVVLREMGKRGQAREDYAKKA